MIARAVKRRAPAREELRDGRLVLNLPRDESRPMAFFFGVFAMFFVMSAVFHGTVTVAPRPEPREEPLLIVEAEPPPPPPPPPPSPPEPEVRPRPAEAAPAPAAPPPPEPAPEPPAAPRLGLEAEDMGGGELSVAAGNSLAVKADTVPSPPPPAPRPAPVGLDKAPTVLSKVVPAYPAWAEEQGVSSRVIVMLTIDERGGVTAAEVTASGGQEFDENAVAAGRATRFQPLIRNGIAVPARFQVTYDFNP